MKKRTNEKHGSDLNPAHPSRRGFLKNTFVGAMATGAALPAATAVPPPPTGNGTPDFDFSHQSAALMPDQVVTSACQFCNSLCGLKVALKGERVISVEGLPEDPVQAGALCAKGPMMAQLVDNRHRLTTPLRRVDGEKGTANTRFEPCSWDEAFDIIARKWLALRDAGEAHTIANRSSGRMLRGADALIGRILARLGSPNAADVGPVCNDAGGNALTSTFGLGAFTNGYGIDPITGTEDLGASDFYLFLGTNQAETHPVTFAHLLRGRAEHGAQLVVVDPRRTPTGSYADTWLAPKPHTDLALVLGMLGHIVSNELYDADFVANWVTGFEELRVHLKTEGYTPDWAAQQCGIDANAIRHLAEAYARAKTAAIFCNAGVSHQINAYTTYRALTMLAAITGNIGKPGTGCNFMHNTWPGPLELPPLTSPSPAPSHPALPVGPDSFANAILEDSPYTLRAVMTQGNPLISSANTQRVRDAFKKLEFYVYTGLFMEESAYFADLILPVCSGLELDGVYMRRDDRGIRWQEQAVPRVGESKTDVEIFVGIAQALARHDAQHPAAYWLDNVQPAWADYSTLWNEFVTRTPGMAGMSKERLKARVEPLRWPCPTPHHPGTSTLYMDHPAWYEAVAALAPAHRGKRFPTPSGTIELYTDALQAKLQQAGHQALPHYFTHPEVKRGTTSISYGHPIPNPIHPNALTFHVTHAAMDAPSALADFPLMGMTGRPSVVHFASMTHWLDEAKRLNGIRFVQIHPETAKAVGVEHGETVAIVSPRGRIEATALYWKDIRPDTIFVPNGFGPAQVAGDGLRLPRYEGVNILLDDRYFDTLSGQQAYKCFACRIEPVA